MILGIISLTLFMIAQSGIITHSHPWFLPLEFVHFLIFVLALIFIMQAAIMLFVIRPVKRGWEECSHWSFDQIRSSLEKDADRVGWKGGLRFRCFYSCDFRKWIYGSYHNTQDVVEFHLLRAIFCKMHDLPQQFDFTRYVQDSLTDLSVDMVEIGPLAWMVLLVLVWLYTAIPKGSRNNFPWYFTIIPYVGLALVMLLILFMAEHNITRCLNRFRLHSTSVVGMHHSITAVEEILKDALAKEEALVQKLQSDFNEARRGRHEGRRRLKTQATKQRVNETSLEMRGAATRSRSGSQSQVNAAHVNIAAA